MSVYSVIPEKDRNLLLSCFIILAATSGASDKARNEFVIGKCFRKFPMTEPFRRAHDFSQPDMAHSDKSPDDPEKTGD
jgi:hypothetical protein